MSRKNRSSIDEWCRQYEKVLPDYIRCAQKIDYLIRDLLRAKNIGYHLIESRAKEVSSFRDKVMRASKSYSNPLEELTDLAGIRIISYYQHDAQDIANLIKQEFYVDGDNSIEHSPSGAEFGYRSTHYVVRLSEARSSLPEWAGLSTFKFEIQIRTVLQHAWAAISHKLQYKREDDVPEPLRRKLFRLSALFELADDEFVSLRDASVKLSEEIEGKLSLGEKDIKINYVSLSNFIDNSECVAELCAYAEAVGFEFGSPQIEDSPDDYLSDLIQLAAVVRVLDISQFDSILRGASSWAEDYLLRQYSASETPDDSSWYASPEFICSLILIGDRYEDVGVEDLINLGWDFDIADRVLDVANEFKSGS